MTTQARAGFASAFTDHMVLQQGARLSAWGFGAPGEAVTVSFAGRTEVARVGRSGRWTVMLPQLSASAQGRRLSATVGDTRLSCRNVLVGEVWLRAGQSNMELGVDSADHAQEMAAAADLPGLRLYLVPKSSSPVPLESVLARWRVCTCAWWFITAGADFLPWPTGSGGG